MSRERHSLEVKGQSVVEGERRSPRVPLVLSVTSVPPTGEMSQMALTNSPWIPDPCDSVRHTLYKTKQNKGEKLRIVEVNIRAWGEEAINKAPGN